MPQDYLTTSQAFDVIAADYDVTYGPSGNAVMTWMRGESLNLLEQMFPPGSSLLEIGCGTGEEALHLAQAGRTVLATDISSRMAAHTRAKAQAAGLSDRVMALALPAGRLRALHPPVPFDGAYASFGSLNCEPDVPALSSALTDLLRPGAAFVCSVMARWCPFEILWFLLHGRPREAFRRLHGGWQPAPVAGKDAQVTIQVRYLSAGDIARAFLPAFAFERVLALPLLLPPPYLDELFRRHRNLFTHLETWERRLRGRWPWRYLGDHVVVVLRKR